jgi:uncharacterized protein
MTPLVFTLITLAVSFGAGLLGALIGLGGGIIVVPALTLLLHIDIRYAIGASIVAVIATSSGAAAAYVREHMTSLRVAMFLELATTSGAITGAFLAGVIGGRWLFIVFGLMLAYSGLASLRRVSHAEEKAVPADRLADELGLHGTFCDPAEKQEVAYRVTHAKGGLALMYVAGAASGLLGIGSGTLKVLAMDMVMRLPFKVSTATSNFMIGVTAAASAGVYFARGDIDSFVAAPVAAGVLAGAVVGSRLLPRVQSRTVRIIFTVALLWVSVQMLLRGIR